MDTTAHLTEAAPVETPEQKIERVAKMYIDQYILACQSSLLSTILQVGFEHRTDLPTLDDVENLYLDTSDWEEDRLRDYVEGEMGIEWNLFLRDTLNILPDNDDEINEWDTEEGPVPDPAYDDLDYWLDDIREAVLEHARDNGTDTAEVYEWWLVDRWLHAQLRSIGQPVLDDGQSFWWGRTCTGQAIYLDGTIQQIAKAQIAQYAWI